MTILVYLMVIEVATSPVPGPAFEGGFILLRRLGLDFAQVASASMS